MARRLNFSRKAGDFSCEEVHPNNKHAIERTALSLGDTTEQVTVNAEASVLETETSSRGSVIDQRKIVELPLNGRDYNQLAMLSPGVLLPTPRFASIGFKGVFNVNGNRATQNAFVLDGVGKVSYASSYRGMNMQIVQPSVDALQEFKVQTNGYAAEFGRSSGALINAVVKSGGNQIHGSGYEFLRNRALDATNFFSNKSGAAKPARLRNQFGGRRDHIHHSGSRHKQGNSARNRRGDGKAMLLLWQIAPGCAR